MTKTSLLGTYRSKGKKEELGERDISLSDLEYEAQGCGPIWSASGKRFSSSCF
ncbi:hypothetical protein STEG23_022096, partial [Scotinomys teguina]